MSVELSLRDHVRTCSGTVNLGRPDRGPEHRCSRKARWFVNAPVSHGFVCGHHARAYARRALVPVYLEPRP